MTASGQVPLCSGCRHVGHGTCRLGVRREGLLTDNTFEAEASCPAEYEGWRGMAHGGWTSSVLDEVLGHGLLAMKRRVVTSSLQITFLRPVPIGTPVLVRGQLVLREEELCVMVGEMRTLGRESALLATAKGMWRSKKPGTPSDVP